MFDTLGINAAEFRDAPLEGKLIVLADAWERNTATGEGTAQMLELLGHRAQQLIPLLIAGPEELRKKLAEVSVAVVPWNTSWPLLDPVHSAESARLKFSPSTRNAPSSPCQLISSAKV